MSKLIRFFMGVSLILVSLGCFFYPDLKNMDVKKEVQDIEEKIEIQDSDSREEDLQREDKNKNKEALYQEMKKYNQELALKGQELVDVWSYEDLPVNFKNLTEENSVVGYIEIPDMMVELPLLVGASEDNLAKGAGILSETSMPVGGEDTNCVIAAHRGWKGSTYFQYIENMLPGSKVYVHTLWETREYEAVEIKIVDAHDLDSILIKQGKDMITLMSCHPYGIPGGNLRYLVYCEYVEKAEVQEIKDEEQEKEKEKKEELVYASGQEIKSSKEWIRWENRIRYILPGIVMLYFLFLYIKNK